MTETKSASHFDEKAQTWDSDPMRVYAGQKIARAILKGLHLDGTETAFEFGAGTGLATLIMAPKVRAITALDASAGMLDVLASKCTHKQHDHVQAQVGTVPDDMPDTLFDVIYSAMTLHHITDVAGLFVALHAHLKPGGQIALADLDKEDGSFHGQHADVPHTGFEREDIRQWLAHAGFADITFSTAFTQRKQGEDGTVRSFPIFLVTANKP